MGTTRDAIDAGSATIIYTACIEGWSEVFTNGDTTAVATAYSGTGWSTVKGGLFVEGRIDQSMNPEQPFAPMGSCVLHMAPQGNGSADVFGVAVGRKTSPFETYLDATLTNTATTITLKSTAGLSNGGYVHIGTECIQIGTVASSTSLTGCTRGCFTPLGSYANYIAGATTNSFSHVHTVGEDANAVNLQPKVTSTPQIWIGRWVVVRAHRVVGGVVDTVAQAERIFVGQIADIRDNPNNGAVSIQLRPATEIADVAIGALQWEGVAEDGLYLKAGDTFYFTDHDASAQTDADPLVVVASGASGANQINAGYYTLGDLCTALSTWTADEKTAGNITGAYSFSSPVSIQGGELRTKIYWTLAPSSLIQVVWGISMPPGVCTFLGFDNVALVDPDHPNNRLVRYVGPPSNSPSHFHPGGTPGRATIIPNGDGSARAMFTTRTGEPQDQVNTMPNSILGAAASAPYTTRWAIFQIGKRTVLAYYTDNGDGTVELQFIQPAFPDRVNVAVNNEPITFPADGSDVLSAKQVYYFQSDPVTMIVSLLCSMGADGYNSPYAASFTLPKSCSASIPYELVASLPNTMAGLGGITGPAGMTIVVEKSTTLADLIGSDFAVRMVFLCWRNGEISMGEWRQPTSSLAVESLSDANKAAPAGTQDNHVAATAETSDWVRPIVKLRFNRSAADPGGDEYRDTITYIDRTSVENMGGAAKTKTINLRNTYAEFGGHTQSVKALLPRFQATLPLISRPARKVTRSIDSRCFLRLGLSDVVLLTDISARDPETGLRGLSARPALVTRLSYSLGGSDIGGSTMPVAGQIDLMFSDQNPEKSGAPYVPAAMVNDLYSVGSYDHGYLSSGPTLRLLTNRFTETTDSGGRDSAYLNPGDNVIIIERDPADPDAPVKWSRTIAASGVSGDDITLTSALSSPDWDNTKQYYVISQTYSAATTTQHLNTYQADETDALIEDATGPYLYGSGGGSPTYTTNAGMDALYPYSYVNTVEMPPTLARQDGAGRDVAWEAALARLLNNLIDVKLQPQLPTLSNVEMSNTTVTGTGYQLVAYSPIWLNFENPSATIYRLMTLALMARSTDGTSTKARVTLSRERPSFPTTDNVAWAGTYAQKEWTGITSTTLALLSDGTVTTNIKSALGEAWLCIELGYKCATRGIAKCVVGARQSV